jgi:DNA helicase-2/ATP-dependent DNA helicase PcrA
MINWVIPAFSGAARCIIKLSGAISIYFGDEYQDSNGSQNKLVEQLISFWQDESPNIFVVGDDDQSIYRFQGPT